MPSALMAELSSVPAAELAVLEQDRDLRKAAADAAATAVVEAVADGIEDDATGADPPNNSLMSREPPAVLPLSAPAAPPIPAPAAPPVSAPAAPPIFAHATSLWTSPPMARSHAMWIPPDLYF